MKSLQGNGMCVMVQMEEEGKELEQNVGKSEGYLGDQKLPNQGV